MSSDNPTVSMPLDVVGGPKTPHERETLPVVLTTGDGLLASILRASTFHLGGAEHLPGKCIP
jgi:hypothetical protein